MLTCGKHWQGRYIRSSRTSRAAKGLMSTRMQFGAMLFAPRDAETAVAKAKLKICIFAEHSRPLYLARYIQIIQIQIAHMHRDYHQKTCFATQQFQSTFSDIIPSKMLEVQAEQLKQWLLGKQSFLSSECRMPMSETRDLKETWLTT